MAEYVRTMLEPVRDEPYQCGYDPSGKSLKQCADHWRTCKSSQCQQSHQNHEDTKAYFARRLGR